jgi:hypothetical protein
MYSWQHDYIAALAETDPAKQSRRVYEATAAIEQGGLSPVDPDGDEHHALKRATKALRIMKKNLSTSGRTIEYWRVFIEYVDGKISANKVFKERARAERWAGRQARSKVVAQCRLEPFIRDLGKRRKRFT